MTWIDLNEKSNKPCASYYHLEHHPLRLERVEAKVEAEIRWARKASLALQCGALAVFEVFATASLTNETGIICRIVFGF